MQKKTGVIQLARLAVLAVLPCLIVCAQGAAQAAKKAVSGQKITTVIDRPEVLVLKADLDPGTAVPKQAHNDAKFSLLLPITSGIELTIGSEQPVLTEAGYGYFILPGTPYSMRNPGTIAASVFEVLVNDPAAAKGQRGALAQSGSLVNASLAYAQAPAGAPAGRGRGGAGAGGGEDNAEGGGQIDRLEVRVLRHTMTVGDVRAMHKHDNVAFHLIMPITPGVEVTIGSEKPVLLEPGQAAFMLKGTMHSFRNTATVPAVTYEVFINLGPAAAPTSAAIRKDESSAVMALRAANEMK